MEWEKEPREWTQLTAKTIEHDINVEVVDIGSQPSVSIAKESSRKDSSVNNHISTHQTSPKM